MKKIIHCDCDCFYASIEMRDDPSLRGRPLAVGGRPDQRGVVATCNYEARRFGIHSAMPMSQAIRRCPDLVILPPAMEKYRIASRQILAIYRDYTDAVEPLSLDEAYLDVSESPQHHGSATLIAHEIRARIADTVGITASAGVAPNKFLAKIASDWNKPDGMFVILPDQVHDFVATLPVKRLFGVGKVTAAKLHSMGIIKCKDLLTWSLSDLTLHFGKLGNNLYQLCRGIDLREVDTSSERKSVSVEETYTNDLPDLAACVAEMPELYTSLVRRADRAGAIPHIHKLFVKIRFSDFRVTTVECVGKNMSQEVYGQLLETGFARRHLPVRLLGLGLRLAETDKVSSGQLTLF
ncbi:DNA polymerase IV [Undibacterium sp. SXout11W]|uniref:DNA polymerase IV n=1 Tax=Undibacterium sp. SXout11W TaxID=3413050 RepID=UPI003BF39AE3